MFTSDPCSCYEMCLFQPKEQIYKACPESYCNSTPCICISGLFLFSLLPNWKYVLFARFLSTVFNCLNIGHIMVWKLGCVNNLVTHMKGRGENNETYS